MKATRKMILFTLFAALSLLAGLFATACGEGVTLSFVTDGSPVAPIRASAGEQVQLPSSLKSGQVLEGWCLSEDGTGPVLKGEIAAPDADTTYYAKWTQGYTLSFDADGGVFAEGIPSLTLAAEEDLFSATQNIRPTKSGLTFGGWFLGDEEVTSSTKMPASNVTLTAKYRVEYCVEVYLHNLAGNSYVRAEELTYASDYVGATVRPDAPMVTGFARTDFPEGGSPVSELTLSQDASRNVCRFYYDRLTCRVMFDANAPQGAFSGSVEPVEALYEGTQQLPQNAFSYPGYRFAGWSSFSGGSVDFLPGEEFHLFGDSILYAVWDRGFADRYGGEDLIFFPQSDPELAILSRGGEEFTGTRDGDSFSFTAPSGRLFEGKVYGTMYSYRRADLAGKYVFYANTPDPRLSEEQLYDEGRTLEIDEYLNATYTNGSSVRTGSVSFSDELGDYIFTSGEESFHFLPAFKDALHDYAYDRVFSIGGAEVGGYIDFIMVDPDVGMGFVGNSMVLVLDGYSNAALLDAQNYITYETNCRYYVEGIYTVGTTEIFRIVCYIYDEYGYLTGTAGQYVTNYIYTLPLSDPEFDGYVEADSYRGSYEDEGGDSITLDGFGIFADSALYTKGGKEIRGMYRVSSDLMSGDVLTLMPEDGSDPLVFRLDTAHRSFHPPVETGALNYTEFRRMDGSSLQPPFLVVYEEDVLQNGAPLGKRTEVWVPSDDESALVKAADGYCTVSPIGGNSRLTFSLYTFTRTAMAEGYTGTEEEIPERLVFYNAVVTSTTDYRSYNIYCVLEERIHGTDTSYWTRYSVSGGGEIWKCSSVTTGGLGALYLDERGSVQEGQFTTAPGENFSGIIGTFLYATEEGIEESLYFDITQNDDGTLNASSRTGVEQMYYVIQPTGVEAGGVGTEIFFTDGVSRAKYSSDRGERFIEGTFAPVDSTCFGETIYSFTVSGLERFRFVMYELPEEQYAGVPLIIKYDGDFASLLGTDSLDGFTFVGDGERFILDGYHAATLGTMHGEYFRDVLCRTVTFTASSGDQFVLELDFDPSAGSYTFRRMDWATGRTWQLLNNNFEPINGLSVAFLDNGYEKAVKVLDQNGAERSSGSYVPLGSFNDTWGHEEYLLRSLSLGDGYPTGTYRVTFAINSEGVGACLVFDPSESGVFTDDDWNVLLLDGYGRGQLFTGDYSGSGSYTVEDFEKHFISFTVDDSYSSVVDETFYFRTEGTSFFMTDYSRYAGVFFSESMESIVFGTESDVYGAGGILYVGTSSGPYYAEDGYAYAYLDDTPIRLPLPSGERYEYGGKVYHRWAEQALTMRGTVRFLDEEGATSDQYPALPSTLTFAPNRTTNMNRPLTFTFEGHTDEAGKPVAYTGYSLSLYVSGDAITGEGGGSFSPTVRYGRYSYPISFSYAEGNYTFTVNAGYSSVEYLDHNARYYPEISTPRGARLFKSSFGFGAITYGDTLISGDFLYLYKSGDAVYGAPLHFESVKESDARAVGYVPGYGDRLEIAFTASDGRSYLLNYYEYYEGGNYFWCYGLFSYRDVASGEYTVRVKTLLYTKMSIAPGYSDAQNGTGAALGKISEVTLLKEEQPVVAYDAGITPNGYDHSVWLVDRADVVENGSIGTCTWGRGYLVTFTFAGDGKTVTAAAVREYRFAQVVNYMQHLANLFFDEEDNVLLASLLIYNPEFGRYEFVSDPQELTQGEDGAFTFRAGWDGERHSYTVRVASGEPVIFEKEGSTVTKPGYTVSVTVG